MQAVDSCPGFCLDQRAFDDLRQRAVERSRRQAAEGQHLRPTHTVGCGEHQRVCRLLRISAQAAPGGLEQAAEQRFTPLFG